MNRFVKRTVLPLALFLVLVVGALPLYSNLSGLAISFGVSTDSVSESVPEGAKSPKAVNEAVRISPNLTAEPEFNRFHCGDSPIEFDRGVLYAYWCDGSHKKMEAECSGVKEAVRAAESVRVAFTNGSDIPIALITNAAFMTREKVFSKVIVWNETQVLDKSLRLRIKIQAMCESPFERTLFLDTDTMVLEDVTELFDIVSVYDVALAERPPFRPSYASGAMAHIKNTYNTGMILFRRNARTHILFQAWAFRYYQKRSHRSHFLDQKALWKVMTHFDVPDLRVAELPFSYNFRPKPFSRLFHGPIRILHHRQILENATALDVILQAQREQAATRLWRIYSLLDFDFVFSQREADSIRGDNE